MKTNYNIAFDKTTWTDRKKALEKLIETLDSVKEYYELEHKETTDYVNSSGYGLCNIIENLYKNKLLTRYQVYFCTNLLRQRSGNIHVFYAHDNTKFSADVIASYYDLNYYHWPKMAYHKRKQWLEKHLQAVNHELNKLKWNK